MLAEESNATSPGLLNQASAAGPSLRPETPGMPATVDVWPEAEVRRMVEFLVSAT